MCGVRFSPLQNVPQRIAARDIPRVIRAIDQEVQVTALTGAEAAGMKASADFILDNMSARMADQLREEVEERDKVSASDMEEASSLIVQSIRDMEAAGDLLLVVEESEIE